MNEFTVPDRLKWLAVTIAVAVAAVPLSFLLWRTPAGVATPPPSLLLLFIPIGVVIPSLALGIGVAFMLFGKRFVRTGSAPGLSRASFVSIGWLLTSWWPHANFHRIANGWANLLLVDYFFHTTAIIAAVVIAAYFLAVVRERQEAGQTETDTSNLASSSRA